jgi:hypothetical protein
MVINLIMTSGFTGAEINAIVDGAVCIWQECFHRHTRAHTTERVDKHTKHRPCGTSTGYTNTERDFRKRAIEDTAARAASSTFDVDSLQSVTRPSAWTDKHEDELGFQKDKRRKREVEAVIKGHLLPEEHTDELRQAADAEIKRQAISYRDRLNTREKYTNKTTAVPPTYVELRNAKIYLQGMWTNSLNGRLVDVNGTVARAPYDATMFITDDPRPDKANICHVVAAMRGSWIMTPSVFLGHPGPCIKFVTALDTVRFLYATQLFRASFPNEWLAILEVIQKSVETNRRSVKWRVLSTPGQWAAERALAETKKRPASVIALAAGVECKPTLHHVFTLDGLFKFIAKTDPKKGSIGLLDM